MNIYNNKYKYLDHYRIRSEPVHSLGKYSLKDANEHGIIHALLQRHVHRVVAATPKAHVLERAGAGEEARLVAVDGEGEDPVGAGEGLLHPVPMVHVQVHVHHPIKACL